MLESMQLCNVHAMEGHSFVDNRAACHVPKSDNGGFLRDRSIRKVSWVHRDSFIWLKFKIDKQHYYLHPARFIELQRMCSRDSKLYASMYAFLKGDFQDQDNRHQCDDSKLCSILKSLSVDSLQGVETYLGTGNHAKHLYRQAINNLLTIMYEIMISLPCSVYMLFIIFLNLPIRIFAVFFFAIKSLVQSFCSRPRKIFTSPLTEPDYNVSTLLLRHRYGVIGVIQNSLPIAMFIGISILYIIYCCQRK